MLASVKRSWGSHPSTFAAFANDRHMDWSRNRAILTASRERESLNGFTSIESKIQSPALAALAARLTAFLENTLSNRQKYLNCPDHSRRIPARATEYEDY